MLADGLSRAISNSNSPQVSLILLSIQANLNNAGMWMVSFHLLIFRFTIFFQFWRQFIVHKLPLVTPSSIFFSQGNYQYLSIFSLSFPCEQQTQKMVLDPPLLNTQHYKVRIKGKVEQSWEGVAPPTPWCSSYRKGSLRVTLDYGHQLYFYFIIISSTTTTTALFFQFWLIYIYIYIRVCILVDILI